MTVKSLLSKLNSPFKFVLAAVVTALLATVMVLVYTGVFLWNISFLAGPALDNPYATGSPFTLAQVMAIFGAFGMVASFSDRVEQRLRRSMCWVAVCHFLAALSFCLLGLILPAIPHAQEGTAGYWIIIVAILGSILAAALSFWELYLCVPRSCLRSLAAAASSLLLISPFVLWLGA